MSKRILVATGQDSINRFVSTLGDYEYLGEVEDREALEEVAISIKPDILLVADGLGGKSTQSIPSIILSIKQKEKDIRVIYLTTTKLTDDVKVGALAMLVTAGVYDVIYNRKLTEDTLKEIIQYPKEIDDRDTSRIISAFERINGRNKKQELEFHVSEETIIQELDDGSYSNVSVVSSIKPGTGKSFVSSNVATAIAKYGENTESGKKPRVAIIEADLQNLSIGTLLQIEDNRKNIKTAMNAIKEIITDDGLLIQNSSLIEDTDEVIKSCFLPYKGIPNLYALVGSQLSFEEVNNFKGFHFSYLIDSIADDYDVIIVDSNSSLAHSTTFTLLAKASSCYYVLNLDFNNVRNNIRYKDLLKEIGISHKIKYILNEDVTNPLGDEMEILQFDTSHLADAGFQFVSKIPLIPKTVFLNRLYGGTPIVLDEVEYTQSAKYELLKAANDIYPIEGFDSMSSNPRRKKRGFFGIL